MEAEIGKMLHKPRITGSPGDTGAERIPPQSSRENQPCQYLDLGLLACRAVREYIPVVLSPPVCGPLSWKPQETNMAPVEDYTLVCQTPETPKLVIAQVVLALRKL